MQFSCLHCATRIEVADALVGRQVICPICMEVMPVPNPVVTIHATTIDRAALAKLGGRATFWISMLVFSFSAAWLFHAELAQYVKGVGLLLGFEEKAEATDRIRAQAATKAAPSAPALPYTD